MSSVNNEIIPRIEKIESIEPEEDLREECNVCNGRRIVPAEKIILKAPCKACGGSGKLYWVDKAMQKESKIINTDVIYRCSRENITFLLQLAKELGQRVGYDINVDISPQQYHYPSHIHTSYYDKHTISNIILNGGS